MEHVERLKTRLDEIENLRRASAVLSWDQNTYMPAGGATARADQLATLKALCHRMLVDAETVRLLEAAEAEIQRAGLDADSDEASLLRVTRRDLRQATALPESLVEELERTAALAREAWVSARANDDFAAFAPWLTKNLDLARRQAECLGYSGHPYDALLDIYEQGMTVERLRPIFARLRAELVPLLRAISARTDAVDDAILYRTYNERAQLRFSEEIACGLGFDFTRGRLDLTVHPFALGLAPDDVRLTTRVERTFLPMCLLGTIHEAGHGMYEQGIALSFGIPHITHAASLGLHESQSRLWENIVGRSECFWTYAFPLAQRAFPEALGDVDATTLYRALNKVSPTTIRVEADEVTYNLHIMLRFELETALLEGRLTVGDLPGAWNDLMQEYLGITPPSDAEGVLQDTHWAIGGIGYFPTYCLGNVMSVQLYEAAVRAVPSIPAGMARGDFAPLLGWLRDNVHRYGRKFEPDELVRRATGHALDAEPYLRYLRNKFGAIYGLDDHGS